MESLIFSWWKENKNDTIFFFARRKCVAFAFQRKHLIYGIENDYGDAVSLSARPNADNDIYGGVFDFIDTSKSLTIHRNLIKSKVATSERERHLYFHLHGIGQWKVFEIHINRMARTTITQTHRQHKYFISGNVVLFSKLCVVSSTQNKKKTE